MKQGEQFSPQESRRRLEAALRGARVVGHKPQSEMRLGKPRGKKRTIMRLGKPKAHESPAFETALKGSRPSPMLLAPASPLVRHNW
jgi:hypothetical protein